MGLRRRRESRTLKITTLGCRRTRLFRTVSSFGVWCFVGLFWKILIKKITVLLIFKNLYSGP